MCWARVFGSSLITATGGSPLHHWKPLCDSPGMVCSKASGVLFTLWSVRDSEHYLLHAVPPSWKLCFWPLDRIIGIECVNGEVLLQEKHLGRRMQNWCSQVRTLWELARKVSHFHRPWISSGQGWFREYFAFAGTPSDDSDFFGHGPLPIWTIQYREKATALDTSFDLFILLITCTITSSSVLRSPLGVARTPRDGTVASQ
jgi:hypothetical protein